MTGLSNAILDKAYNPNQPRLPEGMPGGGRWGTPFAPLSWDAADQLLVDTFGFALNEPRQEKNPRSGYMGPVGVERRIARPERGTEGPLEFNLWDHDMPGYVNDKTVGTEPVTRVFRGMAMGEFEAARERGYIASDRRGVIAEWEGTNAGLDPRTAMSYLPVGGEGVIVEIEVRPEDEWFTIHEDEYARTRGGLSWDSVKKVTPVIAKDKRTYLSVVAPAPSLGRPTVKVDPIALAFRAKAYNPNQPRLPEGMPGGGRWGNLAGLIADALEPDGGFTWSPRKGKAKGGKAVSPFPERSKGVTPAEWNERVLKDYVIANADLLADDKNYVGAWHNPNDGKIVLDMSIVVKTHEEAVEIGRRYNQEAYYDLDTFEPVPINAPGTARQHYEPEVPRLAMEAPEPGKVDLSEQHGAKLSNLVDEPVQITMNSTADNHVISVTTVPVVTPPPHPSFRPKVEYREVARISWNKSDGHVEAIHTQPDFKRRGIATELNRVAISVSGEHGLTEPVASTRQTGEGAAWRASLGSDSKIPRLAMEGPEPFKAPTPAPKDRGVDHWGKGVDSLFPTRDGYPIPIRIAPWPSASRRKDEPPYDKQAVDEALTNPPPPTRVDPRGLYATQPNITWEGVDYYANDPRYRLTGRTYVDQTNAGNRLPVIYVRPDGRTIILSGHHRAAAALVRGTHLDAILVRAPS